MTPSVKRLLYGLGALMVVVIFSMLFWRLPWWIDGAHIRSKNLQPADGVVITGVRTGLVALGAAGIAGAGLVYTHQNLKHTREKDREQADLVREGQVTDRYVEAIKLLASDGVTEQLGGIYALERIMKDSEKDHETIVEVVAGFIRENSRRPQETPSGYEGVRPSGIVQAALTVLGRRPLRGEANCVDLRDLDLRGADLSAGYLAKTDFTGSDLRGADLCAAHLHKANLRRTLLDGTAFTEAIMDGAFLDEAKGKDVSFNSAVLRHAHFGEIELTGVDFSSCDLWNSVWFSSKVVGADFELADLRYAHLVRAEIKNSTLGRSHLSLANVAEVDLAGCEMSSADLTGAILLSGDLTEVEGLSPSRLADAGIVGSEVKLPEGLEDAPQVAERIAASREIAWVPMLTARSETPSGCCLDGFKLDHMTAMTVSVPTEEERDQLVDEAMISFRVES
ncbi:pentapeptide repeat-containing protein [Streptomyces asiaticus]|uniref:pentapeptide repeat-containing protein n=1 Tax=Streptomyces asiaticus TaxID=114695 RepID=UPI0039BE3247